MRYYGFFSLKKKRPYLSLVPKKIPKKIHICILYDCLRNGHSECPQSFNTITGGVTLCLCKCHNIAIEPLSTYTNEKGGGR